MLGQGGGSEDVDETFAHHSMDGFGAFILRRNMFGPVRGEWLDRRALIFQVGLSTIRRPGGPASAASTAKIRSNTPMRLQCTKRLYSVLWGASRRCWP